MCPREPRCKIWCLCLVFCWTRQCPHMFCFSNGPAEAVSWWREKCMNPPHGKENRGFWADFGWCFHPVWWIWMNFAWISIPLHYFWMRHLFPRASEGFALVPRPKHRSGRHVAIIHFKWRSMIQMMQMWKQRTRHETIGLTIQSFESFCVFALVFFLAWRLAQTSLLSVSTVGGWDTCHVCLEDEALAILWAGRKVCKQHIVALKALTNAEFLKFATSVKYQFS